MRYSPKNTKPQINRDTLDVLWRAVREADQKGKAEEFLRGILTESEQLMLGRRLFISSLLLRGMPQTEIRARLRLSPNTTWKVKQWLEEQLPGYDHLLKRLDESRRRAPARQYPAPFSFTWMKRKYPMHFLLFTVADEVIDRLNRRSSK